MDGADLEAWKWGWTLFAAILGIGELVIPGFFLLPFVVGAVGAAVLAWLGAPLSAQWVAFVALWVVAFVLLRRALRRSAESDQPGIGANRWAGSEGWVVEAIDPDTGEGTVRIVAEVWRATALAPIATGSKVVVVEVAGTRLVVEEPARSI